MITGFNLGLLKARTIRVLEVITAPPGFAFVTLTWIHSLLRATFDLFWYSMTILFLVIVPMLPYCTGIIPKFRELNRKTERRLAFVTGVASYFTGTVISYAFNAPRIVRTIFTAYLFSGFALSFVNGILKFKASGHACGVSGPLTLLLRFVGSKAIILGVLLVAVMWSRLAMGRHTLSELVVGTLVGVGSTMAAILVVSQMV